MKKIVERKVYINKLVSYKDKGIIKVITGLRRSGKSTLLLLFKNWLIENCEKNISHKFKLIINKRKRIT